MPAHQQTLALHKGGRRDPAQKGLLRNTTTHFPPDWELELCTSALVLLEILITVQILIIT